MYLVCISFGGIPRKLPKFPAFSAENKTFNKINGTLPKVGQEEVHRLGSLAFKGHLSVTDSCYLYVVNALAYTEKLCDRVISSQTWICPKTSSV